MPANGRKSIFITGAASGIGRATALLFAKNGWFVGGFDVNAQGLTALADDIGAENCITGVLDVTDKTAFEAALASFAAQTDGRLDLLYNNAGIGRGGPFDQQPFEDILDVVRVNLIGVLNGIHSALPLLKATPNSLCFTTSSSSATYGMPNIAVYSATKHAVKGLTEALSIEFRAFGVRAADTLPGLIDTPILPPEAARTAPTEGMFRLTPPSEVAQAVWDAYGSDKLHWYVPPEIGDLDKAATLSPETVREQLAQGGLFNRDSGQP
ncbi:MAG TPA: SDR family oxidoreductase [Caulobacteraceae bacterium]|jgi:NAD(P)-dependent dehydrogenase (short-subunit alcohol dehydrogenase family)|nr:SDR family oxidoreductase [Caulobacteraceae bacterium]